MLKQNPNARTGQGFIFVSDLAQFVREILCSRNYAKHRGRRSRRSKERQARKRSGYFDPSDNNERPNVKARELPLLCSKLAQLGVVITKG